MPRRRIAQRREVLPDPIYNSALVTKFINGVMWGGKKSVAEGIFYGAMEQIGEKTGEEPLKVFKRAIDNTKPTVEVKSRRVGGSTYQVPIEVHQVPTRRLPITSGKKKGFGLWSLVFCQRPRAKDQRPDFKWLSTT
jgi:small subunit ribosomal protein S7